MHHAYRISTDGRLEGVVARVGNRYAWTCLIDGASGTAATDYEATAALTAAWRSAQKIWFSPLAPGNGAA